MKIGFDYWQVLSHHGDRLRPLIDACTAAGHEVVVISAVGHRRAGTVEPAVRALGFAMPVHEVVFSDPRESPQLKLARCSELGVTVFYDDRDDVCRLLSRHGILALRVTRQDATGSDLGAELGAEQGAADR